MNEPWRKPSEQDRQGDWTLHDDLPAYALGLLGSDEAAVFEAHLAECLQCRQELPQQAAVGEALARSLTPSSPPAGARARLLARARAEAGRGQPARPTPVGGASLLRPPDLLRWAAIALFVVAAGLLIAAWGATGPHGSLGSELQARLPGGRVLELVGTGVRQGRARLLAPSGSDRAELAVANLPALPADRVYQLWFAEPGQPIRSGGVFTVAADGGNVAAVTIPAPLARMRAVAVTEEPAPGSTGPTGEHLLDWVP